jgi:putative transposase
MKRIYFENGEIYHVYNRGVDKRTIFNERDDYLRFLNYLEDFNNLKLIDREKEIVKKMTLRKRRSGDGKVQNCEEDILVEVLAFCLMPNHFHLLLRQKREGGISKFLQRITTGYTMIFNSKRKRSGSLVQGRFKAVHVGDQEYLDYLVFYIHFNPLALIDGGWLGDKDGALNFLNNYEWSSHIDYLNSNNYYDGLLTNKEFVFENFKDSKEYRKKLYEWLEIIEEKNKDKYFVAKAIDCEN